jgi:Zn-dependent peptidase ImmA (M78 family)/transcriptional regulator with XRE-family HTH domain
MTKKVANINPEILVWARKTVKLSVDLAAHKIGTTPERLNEWEAGINKPSIKQLYKIADVYKRPFALFYFPEPPKHFKPLKDFRLFPSNVLFSENDEYQFQINLLSFQRKRELALELYEMLDEKPPKFYLRSDIKESPEVVSKKIIEYLKINHNDIANIEPGYDALNYWKNLLELKGILVFQTSKVPLYIMRGACIAEELLPVVIINGYDSPNGRIFSIFHELTHITLRSGSISNFRLREKDFYDQIEIYCNRIAAEILVPSEILLEMDVVKVHGLNKMTWNYNELKYLAGKFCVSQEVILRRLLTHKRTNLSFYQEFRDSQRHDKETKQPGGDYYRKIIAKNGQLFLNLALQGYYQEKLSASSLFDFIQVKISNISKLEERLYA